MLKYKIKAVINSRWFLSIVLTIIALALIEMTFFLFKQKQKIELKQDAIVQGYELANKLDREINRLIYLNTGLEAYIKTNYNHLDEEELIQILQAMYYMEPELLSNFGVAEKYVIKWVYPIAGNEKAIGLDYTKIPDQFPMVELAVKRKKGTLDGPINLVQGGIGLIYRSPVYIDSIYWGLISTVIDLDQLFISAFNGYEDSEYSFAISKTVQPDYQDVIFGDYTIFQHPDAATITSNIPNNTWYFAIIKENELLSKKLILYHIVGLFFVILTFLITFYVKTITEKSRDIYLKYKLLSDKSTDMVWVYNITLKKITYISPSSSKLLGLKPEEIYNKSIDQLIHETSIAIIKKNLHKRYRNYLSDKSTDITFTDEMQQRNKNGQPIWTETISQFNTNKKNQIEIIGVTRNIDTKKKAKLKLLESENKFRTIFNSSNDGLLIIDPVTTNVILGNQQIFDLLGYSENEILGAPIQSFHSKGFNYFDYLQKQNGATLPEDKLAHDIKVKRKNKGEFFADIRFSEVNFQDKKYILCAYRDVTKTIKMTQELVKLNNEKSRFISILAHDLRSPFNGLIGFLELLIGTFDTKDDKGKKKMLGHVFTIAQDIYELLNELLLWSRSQEGLLTLDKKLINFQQLNKGIIGLYQGMIEEKSLKVISDFPIDYSIYADESMLKIIMRNLITNAIKFCHREGTIQIKAIRKTDGYYVKVIDDGIGMNKTVLKNLWKYDKNESRVGTANETGTGFGLKLIKELIEKHGGNISVKSSPDKGSTFKFFLPDL